MSERDLTTGAPQPEVEEVPAVVEEDQQSQSSHRSTRSRSPSPMFKTCEGCGKTNKLMASDLHDECMLCLGTNHLFEMISCTACQALGYKDRLERARRFAHQRHTGCPITARGM